MDTLPFSTKTFRSIIDKFHLPATTPWAFSTTSIHFHQYRQSGNFLGMSVCSLQDAKVVQRGLYLGHDILVLLIPVRMHYEKTQPCSPWNGPRSFIIL